MGTWKTEILGGGAQDPVTLVQAQLSAGLPQNLQNPGQGIPLTVLGFWTEHCGSGNEELFPE